MARPTYKPTPTLRRRVSIAAGGGMSHEEIALAIGVSRNTLEKYYERELSIGAYERRAEILEAMHRAAKKGNAAAQRLYLQVTPRLAAPPIHPDPTSPAAKPPVKGKKEQANEDAKTAHVGTEWDNLLAKPSTPIQ